MKKYLSSIILTACLLAATSCKKYLDINENPNQATTSTPQYVLPNALAVTASLVAVTYHDFGAFTAGYQVNAGGFGGWGSSFTYNYTTSENTGMWTGTYGNLRDYNYILTSTAGKADQVYYNAMARIMRAFSFQMLVDEYGDIPYTDALKGAESLTPKYDKADAIYQDLVAQLNKAIADINGANANVQLPSGTADIMFKGDMTLWKQFANTLKLRILLRASNSSITAFVTSALGSFVTADGFLTTDAIVNPGYLVTSGKQNPFWNTYHSTADGAQSSTGRSRIPSTFILQFYNGNKLADPKRASLVYAAGTSVPNNQLGNETTAPVAPSGRPAWYIGPATYAAATNQLGVLKGRTMGQPILLAAESYFLLAEAAFRGYTLSGTAADNFKAGITASFTYLQKDFSGTLGSGVTTATINADVAAYQTANSTGTYAPLANYTVGRELEGIITQKYIALNFIHGFEAWNEYRRTGFPVSTGTTAANSFASTISQSTRPDRLPVRVAYPSSEYTYNPNNAPSGVSVFTSRIFWDAN